MVVPELVPGQSYFRYFLRGKHSLIVCEAGVFEQTIFSRRGGRICNRGATWASIRAHRVQDGDDEIAWSTILLGASRDDGIIGGWRYRCLHLQTSFPSST
jgi:hypothetical protein